jgi:hypothetical protein
MTATNKWLLISESRGDLIQCTPYRGQPDQHATCFPCSVCVGSKIICISHGQHIATLRESPTALHRVTAPARKGSRHNLHHTGWSIHRSVPSFSPEPTNESSGESQTSVDNRLLGLLSPQTPMCDRYVQYMLEGANPLVLNWLRRGLQSWRCRLSTYHSPTFSTGGLHFPPKGPARSQV